MVDAYNDPSIQSDAAIFDTEFRLLKIALTVVNQSGQTTNLPASDSSGGWELDESLAAAAAVPARTSRNRLIRKAW